MAQYCIPADILATGINAIALQDVGADQLYDACTQASELADSYLRGRYPLPLSNWGGDLRYRTAQVAVYIVLKTRGFNPDAGGDVGWKTDYEDAIRWFEGIQRQAVHPDVTPASPLPGNATYDLPQVRTSAPRCWYQYNSRGRQVVG